ncbi:MAG: cation transporter [Deltaproteobacteria bacterium]|nr:MAG: cation transporter [Deltaproteobacteria bacterium]
MKYAECARCGKLSPRMSLVGNILAAIFKISTGMLTGSKGLVADGVHSIADSFASAFILFSLMIAEKPHDESHPYGYGKVEYISTLLAATFLFVGASLIIVDDVLAVVHGIHETPLDAALLATLACLFYSYMLYRSNICAGTQLGSPAIMADAYESRADSFSAAAVLAGLIGTKLGFIYADAIAAAVVALLIYHMSMEMFLQGLHGLIDSSPDKGIIDRVMKTSLAVEGVEGVRSIHARRMGRKNWIDLIIDVSGKKSILETHTIGENVKRAVIEKIEKVGGISVNCFPVKKTMFGNY